MYITVVNHTLEYKKDAELDKDLTLANKWITSRVLKMLCSSIQQQMLILVELRRVFHCCCLDFPGVLWKIKISHISRSLNPLLPLTSPMTLKNFINLFIKCWNLFSRYSVETKQLPTLTVPWILYFPLHKPCTWLTLHPPQALIFCKRSPSSWDSPWHPIKCVLFSFNFHCYTSTLEHFLSFIPNQNT